MSQRRAKQARINAESTAVASHVALADAIERFSLGLVAALLVVAVLIPTDSIPHVGNDVVIVMLWMIAACVFLTACIVRGSLPLRLGPTAIVAISLLIVHVASLLVMIGNGEGNARAGINMVWRWASMIVAFLLVRHIARNHLQCRALCAVMIALAVGVSSLGLCQYFYANPARAAEFKQLKSEDEVREWLTSGGLPYHEPGTPARQHLEDRIDAKEPVGTFALTNSLGAFVAPWLTLAIAIALVSWSNLALRNRVTAGAVLAGAFIGLCLLLTKSRTSWLALALGLFLLAIHVWFFGLRWSWKLPAAALAAVVVLAAVAIGVGGIDDEVLSESFKSFSYRLEYWQATWAMIRERLWLGCGPGNFKECYTQYKLPQASESVGDPHNCVLEIWATAGTLAVVAFVATIGCALAGIYRPRDRKSAIGGPEKTPNVDEWKMAIPIYVGAAVGVFLAIPVGWMMGGMPSLAVIAVGMPIGVASLFFFQPWVERGRLSPSVLVICLAVLLVNLLAAGGIGYLGVALSWWLLLAVALNLVEPSEVKVVTGRETKVTAENARNAKWSSGAKVVCGRGTAVVAILFFVLATFVCQRTALLPVLRARTFMLNGEDAQARGALVEAEADFAEAARSDAHSPEPWSRLSSVAFQQWVNSDARSAELIQRFEHYAGELRRRDPKSNTTFLFIGDRYLQAYSMTRNRQWLQAAIASYGDAARRYPNGNYHHAQLAWAYYLAGDLSAARESAGESLRLDALNPHQENQLRHRFIFAGTSDNEPENAEQLMKKIRTATSDQN